MDNNIMSHCCKCLKLLNKDDHYGLHSACFEDWFKCPSSSSFGGLTPHSDISDEGTAFASSFFHGKFKKYTAELAGKRYVLKILQADFPHLPKVEYVSNQIAKILRLKVPDFYFLRLEGQDCFVSRHFMDGTRWQKLTHLYHYIPTGREFDVETLSEAIFQVTNKPQDVTLFYETLLFDALVGNHDRHGRNLGILSRGKISRLAPIYDNPSYIGVETLLGADLNPRGKIFTKLSNEPTMKDYVVELKRLKARKVLSAFKRRCVKERIEKILQGGMLDDRVRSAMNRLITKRYDEFIENF